MSTGLLEHGSPDEVVQPPFSARQFPCTEPVIRSATPVTASAVVQLVTFCDTHQGQS